MTSKNIDINTELTKNVQTITLLVSRLEKFVEDVQTNTESLSALEAKLQSLSENVKIISTIVKDEPGKKSLITRVALLEQIIESIQEDFREKIGITNEKLSELSESLKLVCSELRYEENEENSTIIRMTVMEQEIKELKDKLKDNSDSRKEKTIAIIKLLTAALPGLIALLIQLLK